MSGVWQQGIARVLFSEGADDALPAGAGAEVFGSAAGNSVGTGLLVLTPQYGPCLLTAAHVVNAALGWDLYSTISPATDALIAFDLPTKGGDRFYVGRVVDWSPPQDAQDRAEYPVSDIALLQVVQDQSEGGSPLPSDLHLHKPEDFVVLTDEDIDGLGLRCFGFSRSDGAFAEGKVRGVSGAGWLHLVGTDDHGDFVAPGFSGAPAFDVSRRSILGMVVSVDGDDGRRLAFLQSSRNLWRACPALARPYRGLKFFEEEDAGFFFGRDEFVQRMLEKAKSFPLLGVTAASGSGKSSAIRAGLVPKLKADNRTLVIAMRPLGNPWKELARGLLEASPSKLDVFQADDRADEMAGKLRQDSLKLEGYADVLLKATGTDRLVIFVDQFEELFTLSGHEREASHQVPEAQSVTPDFRDLMVATAQLKRSPRVQWIYALRGDFADRAFKHPRFTETVGDGNVMLADMTEEALREAVSRPAAALEVEFEGATATQSDLISRIVRDSGLTAGALPLMQHLLEQLWRKMRDRMLTHADYDELKGVKGALNAHAEAVHATLSLEDQRLAQRLFRRLVNVEENGEVTRRVASRGELDALDAGLWPVAERLAEEDSRLLTLRGPETAGAGPDQTGALRTVEVAHEALQRHWERLTDWANEDRQFLQWRRRLEQRMADQDAFLSGPSLQAALGWLEARRDDLTTQQRAHINASRQHQEEQEREKAQRQADLEHALAEAQTERKRATDLVQEKSGLLHQMRALLTLARRFAIAAACLAVLAFAAAGAAGWYWKDARAQAEIANDQREVADRNATIAREAAAKAEDDTARYAAAIADGLLVQDRPVEALKVVRAGLSGTYSEDDFVRKPAAYAMLSQSLSRLEQVPGVLRGHSSIVTSALFSPNGTKIVTSSEDATVRLWDAGNGRVLLTLMGHTGAVWTAAFSPDGTRIVTASSDKTARLWDAESGRAVGALEGHSGTVNTAAFSPDGTRIVTASSDSTARLWDAASGQALATLEGHTSRVISAAFSPDGTRVVTASQDSMARLWDAASGRALATLEGHTGTIGIAVFSPDGSRILTASQPTLTIWDRTPRDSSARLWDAVSGRLLAKLEGHTNTINTAVFSPDGKRIVTVSSDRTIRMWEVADGRALNVLERQPSTGTIAFSSDGTRIVTASPYTAARLLEAASGRVLVTFKGDARMVRTAAFSPDGNQILTVSADNAARLWDAASGLTMATLAGHTKGVNTAKFSPEGLRIVTASQDNTARIWNVANGRAMATLEAHSNTIFTAEFSPNGTRIVTASRDRTARVWDAASGRVLATLEGHEDAVKSAAFSRDGSWIVTASQDNTARLWDAESGRAVVTLGGHASTVTTAEFSPDGARIVTASWDNTARLWDAASGRAQVTLEGHAGSVLTAKFSPDGTRIVTASEDKTARLWDAASGRAQVMLEGHAASVLTAKFSPDGTRIVTASEDKTARLWDAASGRVLATLEGHTGAVSTAMFSSDGQRIVTASDDGTTRLWDTDNGRALATLDGHTAMFSPNDTLIVTSSSDDTAQVWNVTPAIPSVAPGKINWRLPPPFSQALIDRADIVVPERLTEVERRAILKEDRAR